MGTRVSSIQKDVDKVTAYKGKMGKDEKTLQRALKEWEIFQERIKKVSTYAMLLISTDGANSDIQAMVAKNASVMATLSAKLSFFESELLTIPKETIEQYLNEEKELVPFQKLLMDILEKKPYILSPKIKETLAASSEVHNAPFMIYERSKSSDIEFEPVTDQDKNELPMSEALYEVRYEISGDTTLRRNTYQSMLKHLKSTKIRSPLRIKQK